MPTPVSATANSSRWLTSSPVSTRTLSATPPTDVNFTAFERKFDRICRMRNTSPTCAAATPASTVLMIWSPFADAVWKKV